MSKRMVEYKLNAEYCRREEVATGNRPSDQVKVEIDLVPLTPEQRTVVVRAYDCYLGWGRERLDDIYVQHDGDIGRKYSLEYDHILTQDELLGELARINTIWDSLKPEVDAKKLAYKQAKLAREEKEAADNERSRQFALEAEARKEFRNQALTSQIFKWVADHGTPNQQARQAAGLLPEHEVLESIAAEAFTPLAGESLYCNMLPEDFIHDDDCSEYQLKYSSEAADSVTATEWDRLQALLAKLPSATGEIRYHVGKCRGCDAQVTRTGVKLTITVGLLEFSREYGMPDPAAPPA